MNRPALIPLLFLLALVLSSCAPKGRERAYTLPQKAAELIAAKLPALREPVRVHLYTGGEDEGKTPEASAVVERMAAVSPLIGVKRYDLDKDPNLASVLDANHGPIIILEGKGRSPVAYYGAPREYELEPFLDAVLAVSGVEQPLESSTLALLDGLGEEDAVTFRVFVTPL